MRRTAITLLVVLILLGVYVAVQALRPAPDPVARQTVPAVIHLTGASPAVPWPARGQAMLDVPGAGSLGPVGGSTPVPIASLAKLMTAYVVLRDHPLGPGTDGPAVTITDSDVSLYRSGLAGGESVVKVTAGESLTEYQLLEALLVPSADNLALVLANWDAGSAAAFVTKMNTAAQSLGMTSTHYADTSGVDMATVSNAADQLRIAEIVMQNAVFASIVRQPTITLPVAGTLRNFNTLLGTDGIIGIKTGSTSAAGGCLVFAAEVPLAGRSTVVFGDVLGQRGGGLVPAALSAGKRLLDGAVSAMVPTTAVSAGTHVAEVAAPWVSAVPASPVRAVQLVGWPGMTVRVSFAPAKLSGSVRAGAAVGVFTARLGRQSERVTVRAEGDVSGAPLGWRLRQL